MTVRAYKNWIPYTTKNHFIHDEESYNYYSENQWQEQRRLMKIGDFFLPGPIIKSKCSHSKCFICNQVMNLNDPIIKVYSAGFESWAHNNCVIKSKNKKIYK